MNLHIETNITSAKVFEDFSDSLADEISFGLEYILDEAFPEKKMELINDQSTDWFGLSDLTI